MRFLSLMRKEMRECMLWMLLAAIVVLATGAFFLREAGQRYGDYVHRLGNIQPGSIVSVSELIYRSPLQMLGPVLLVTSIGLGLAMGVQHFWLPYLTGTWPFLIHRSVTRKTIFWAKFAAAIAGFIISVGAVWTALYWYSWHKEIFAIRTTLRVFAEGWLFVLLGLMAYLGTALTGLSEARWWTTRIFGLGFATLVILKVFAPWRLSVAFGVVILGAVILVSLSVDVISKREF